MSVAPEEPVTEVTLPVSVPEDVATMMENIMAMYDNEPEMFDIKKQADYDYIVESLQNLKGTVKGVEQTRKDLTKPFYDWQKAINARFKPFTEWVAAIERKGKQAMARWDNHLAEIERKKRAAAEKAAREREEELRRQAEEAAEKGRIEKAEALEETANSIVPKEVNVGPEKTDGLAKQFDYEVSVTDKKAFVAQAVANPFLLSVIEINETKLKKLVKQMDGDLEVSGLAIKKVRKYSIRS